MKYLRRTIALLILVSVAVCCCSCNESKGAVTVAQTVGYESWDEEVINSNPKKIQYTYYFASVKELLSAVKHEPEKYNNAKVKVLGTLNTKPNESLYDIQLIDFAVDSTTYYPNEGTFDGNALDRYSQERKLLLTENKIDINITNDVQFSVAETGDLVKLYGTLTITRSAIYIDNCQYDLIATLGERVENAKQ